MTEKSPAQRLAEGLTEKFKDESPFANKVFVVRPGRKFDKVAQHMPDRPDSQSVHCFVEKSTGHVFKAEGWNRPAKGVRYETWKDALTAADVYGGYLYA